MFTNHKVKLFFQILLKKENHFMKVKISIKEQKQVKSNIKMNFNCLTEINDNKIASQAFIE
jgi:hypothetical protein